MINKINTNSVNSGNKPYKSQPQFKGAIDGAIGGAILSGLQMCEQVPMINVAVLDLSTAIVPRTVVEGQTNPYAGFEAFRRESSGLIINCMIPGLIVAGIAKTIQSGIMGGKTQLGDCLANEDTIKLVTKYWDEASKIEGLDDRAKVKHTITSILKDTKGVDGHKTVDFNAEGMDFEASVETLTNKALGQEISKKDLNAAYQGIAKQTHATENIKIGKEATEYFSQNLESVLKNSTGILRDLVSGTGKGMTVETFAEKATKLVNAKSLLGMGVIIPLALSAQPINRWITAKSAGKKGAPIYKDFSETQSKDLSGKEKAALFRQKLISVASIAGVAFLSMGCKLPKMKVLQFSSLFPTMDQARIISTATFASRMMASEDKNDLREATFRDIATFSSFYFLGDYVAKGLASLIEKTTNGKYSLINVKTPIKDKANFLDKLWHWTKDTALKSSDEVYGIVKEGATPEAIEAATKKAQQMRSLCQLGNIVFSLAALGIIIPKMYRGKTSREREKELKQMGVDQKTIDKYYPHFMMNNAENKKAVFNEFFTANK